MAWLLAIPTQSEYRPLTQELHPGSQFYRSSVILWTRVAPMMGSSPSNITIEGTAPLFNHGAQPSPSSPICVSFDVSKSSDMADANVVDHGTVYTSSDIDYTVKVEARNLSPFTQYYYQFSICNSDKRSPVARTKTSPAADDDVTSIRLAVYSCSNFPFGFFNAFGNVARRDSVDYIIHLGDYIYEYAIGGKRIASERFLCNAESSRYLSAAVLCFV